VQLAYNLSRSSVVKQKPVLLNHKESTDLIIYPKCDKITQ